MFLFVRVNHKVINVFYLSLKTRIKVISVNMKNSNLKIVFLAISLNFSSTIIILKAQIRWNYQISLLFAVYTLLQVLDDGILCLQVATDTFYRIKIWLTWYISLITITAVLICLYNNLHVKLITILIEIMDQNLKLMMDPIHFSIFFY